MGWTKGAKAAMEGDDQSVLQESLVPLARNTGSIDRDDFDTIPVLHRLAAGVRRTRVRGPARAAADGKVERESDVASAIDGLEVLR